MDWDNLRTNAATRPQMRGDAAAPCAWTLENEVPTPEADDKMPPLFRMKGDDEECIGEIQDKEFRGTTRLRAS